MVIKIRWILIRLRAEYYNRLLRELIKELVDDGLDEDLASDFVYEVIDFKRLNQELKRANTKYII